MTSKSKFRPSPAIVISCVALFLALTGSALAIGKNTVRSAQIVDSTIRTLDLRDNAVAAGKIAPDAVDTTEIAENGVESADVAPDSLTAGDLGASSVTSSEVADQSLTANDLGPDSVGSSDVQASAARSAELPALRPGAKAAAVPPAEPARIVQVSKDAAIEAGKTATVSVACPAGSTVISGGNTATDYRVALTGAMRSGNGWLAHVHSYAPNNETLTVYAYCLSAQTPPIPASLSLAFI